MHDSIALRIAPPGQPGQPCEHRELEQRGGEKVCTGCGQTIYRGWERTSMRTSS